MFMECGTEDDHEEDGCRMSLTGLDWIWHQQGVTTGTR